MPAGVGFDFDHTLGIDNKLERIAFLRLLERVLAEGGRMLGADFADEQRRIDELLAHQRAGDLSIEDAVRSYARDRGIAPTDGHVAYYRDACMALVEEVVVPLPGARAMLSGLRERGIPVAILTNGWSPLQQAKAARVGFDGPVVVSARIGAQKPQPEAFAAMAEALGATLANLWYVGDDPVADIAGSLGAGIGAAIWLDTEGRTYPSGTAPPTRSISGLAELLAIL